MHHLDSCIKRDQLDITCFIISLFNAQHVSDVKTSILRSLRLICWVISWVVLLWYDVCWCYVVVWLGWCGIRMQAEAILKKILQLYCRRFRLYSCEVLGSHRGGAEVLILLGCWSMSLGECFATFLRNVEKFKLGYNVMIGTEYFPSL